MLNVNGNASHFDQCVYRFNTFLFVGKIFSQNIGCDVCSLTHHKQLCNNCDSMSSYITSIFKYCNKEVMTAAGDESTMYKTIKNFNY